MENHKKLSEITSMDDEVNEFHPFLNNFLPNLPNVKHVQYTHGNSEYGADFIIIQEDITLLQETYIGVVVKSTKVQQSDIETIQRQINESFKIPKIIFNGKRKVNLNSVWFITNKTISNNAKEKITEYFEKENISFIDNQHLVALIDKFYPDYWHKMSYEVSAYISKIRTQVEEEDKRYTLIPNLDPDFYIEPEIIRIEEETYNYSKSKKKKKKLVDIKSVCESNRFVIIEAPMGFGKSKLLRQLIKHYTLPEIYEEKKIIPFIIKYTDLFDNDIFNPELIFEHIENCKDIIDNHQKNIIMIDGFDEKEESIENKLTNINELESFIKTNENLSVLLTTRDLNELTTLNDSSGSIIKRYEIRGLTLKKIIYFLEQLCNQLNLKNRIIEDIKKSSLLKELPNSPIAAILLARLFENNNKDLPGNLPELYSMYIELVLGKWDIDKGIESITEYEITQAVLFRISFYFIDNECDYLTKNEYQNIIKNYIYERNLEIDYNKIDSIIINRSGILFKEEKNETILYSHRSFIEFMYAKGKSINNELKITEKVFDISWMNIFYFYIGLKKDCEVLLKEIIEKKPEDEPSQWLRIINLSNFFLAGRNTPYQFFKDNLVNVFVEAAEIYIEKVLKEKKSIFSKVPQLIALWWIQFIIKESYGYDFFANALVDTAILIDDSTHSDTKKIYALFFLGTVGLRLNIYEPFKFLLTKYKEKLPTDITIGIKNEIEIEEVNNTEFMKAKKWLDRRASRIHKQMIKKITEVPINKL